MDLQQLEAFAAVMSAGVSRLPQTLQPQHIQLHSMFPENVVQAVLSKTMDLGAVSLPLEHRGLNIHWFGESPCVAVLPADSELARYEVLPMDVLATQPLITRRVGPALAGRASAHPLNFLNQNYQQSSV